MDKISLRAGLAALALAAAFEADAVTDLPRVKATAITTTGSMVICQGEACALVLQQLQGPDYLQTSSLALPQTDSKISHRQFCTLLDKLKPEGCNASSPPSTPGLDPYWQPNGCGTGGSVNTVLDMIIAAGFRANYSGDLDAPYPGVSFLGACNMHDQCWGVAGDRALCDGAFHRSMEGACSAVADSVERNACHGFAGLYYSAVASTPDGDGNYRDAVAARQCALWASDMQINGCETEEG